MTRGDAWRSERTREVSVVVFLFLRVRVVTSQKASTPPRRAAPYRRTVSATAAPPPRGPSGSSTASPAQEPPARAPVPSRSAPGRPCVRRGKREGVSFLVRVEFATALGQASQWRYFSFDRAGRTSCSCPCTPRSRPIAPRTCRVRRSGSTASSGTPGLQGIRGEQSESQPTASVRVLA